MSQRDRVLKMLRHAGMADAKSCPWWEGAPVFDFGSQYLRSDKRLSERAARQAVMPFSCVAFDDDNSCVWLYLLDRQEDPGIAGKLFRILIGSSSNSCRFGWVMELEGALSREATCTSGAEMMLAKGPLPMIVRGKNVSEQRWTDVAPFLRDGRTWEQEAGAQIEIALNQLALVNDPSRWIVRKTDEIAKKIDGKRRRAQRTRYLIVPRKEMERVVRKGNPENAGVISPHARRAHYRRLTSDRYTKKQGCLVKVSACWVGPRDATIGCSDYRVILDYEEMQ